MTDNTRQHAHAGAFTLVEVVVALALGVTLLVAVQGLIVQVYRSGVEVEERAVRRATQTLPIELLRRDLGSQPTSGGLSLQNGVLSFTTLNAMQSTRVAARHAVWVRYACERTGDGLSRLLRREWELGGDGRTGADVVLIDGVASAALAIYDGHDWHDRWPLRTPRRPRAVRLELGWPDGATRTEIIRLTPLEWRRHDG